MVGFLVDPMLMEDNCEVDDLFEMNSIQDDIWKKIQWLPNKSIFALVWPYGSGKSTIIHNIKQQHKDWENDPIWVQFDSWKYPERKDLWEGFIFEMAEKIWSVSQTHRKVEWEKSFVRKMFGLIPLADKVDNLFTKNSWAKRVFEMQKILHSMIDWFDRDLCIVVEDIDRSWEYGTRFLETLGYFLKNHNYWGKQLRVIVLIGKENYQKDLESYLKCIDAFEFYEPAAPKYLSFVEHHFSSEFIEWTENKIAKNQIITFLEEFTRLEKFTLRLIKYVLRKSDLIYRRQIEDWFSPDFRKVILIEASRYYIENGRLSTDYDRIHRSDIIPIDSMIWRMLKMVYLNVENNAQLANHQSSPIAISPIRIVNSLIDWPFDEHHLLERYYFKY